MAKYKIESTYLEFPIIIETESNDEAYEMFVAYCDYNQVDEDEIECEYDDKGIVSAVAYQQSEEPDEDDEYENIAKFTFEIIK